LKSEVSVIEYIDCKPRIKGELNAEFCVIGGGNTIGGSCYLLKFNGVNILLDAGVIVDLYKKAPKVPMFATEATCELVNKLLGSSIKRQQDYRTERFLSQHILFLC
jgi:Cft2 family RNA processing exonuclease